jgi:hypothetical protein
MESSNFDLKQAIDNYISLINNQGSLTKSDRDELVSHLLDSTEALTTQGLSEEESFIIACKRIGKSEVLTNEYNKVNTSLQSSRVWSYLIVGFNMIYGIPAIVFFAVTVLYYIIHKHFGTSTLAVFMVTFIHLLLIVGLWSIVNYKRKISDAIEKRLEQKPIPFIISTFFPFILMMLFMSRLSKLMPGLSINYPIYQFDSDFTEFSFWLVGLSIVGVFLSLVFSINKVENLTAKTLFNRPSIIFLLLFGFVVELLAASTRAIYIDNIAVQAAIFGLVYAGASFLIAYYNDSASVNRYLLFAALSGFILEVSVGISADMHRGNTYFTAFFATALIAGVIIGRFIGIKSAKRSLALI